MKRRATPQPRPRHALTVRDLADVRGGFYVPEPDGTEKAHAQPPVPAPA